jgi:hypothetical protein
VCQKRVLQGLMKENNEKTRRRGIVPSIAPACAAAACVPAYVHMYICMGREIEFGKAGTGW